ncbi:thioredoxin family protein [Allohahella marinimesophila]|uniref:Thioredoxin domain-containing protein n=1 Tax=Allohahella marinimesophila TaxID=1054972 RepID=A0ABP7NZU9_9GAMM
MLSLYHRTISFLALLMLSAGLHADEVLPINWNDEQLDWHSYEAGVDEIRRTGSVGMLVLYADWCPTCKAYGKLFGEEAVVNSLVGVVLIRANVDTEIGLSSRYDIDGDYVPRTFALDSKARIIEALDPSTEQFWYFLPVSKPDYVVSFAEKLKGLKGDPSSVELTALE